MMRRPEPGEHAEYWTRYISLVPETNIVTALESQIADTGRLLAGVDESRAAHRYAPGKWSIKQLIGHVSDWERIFGYRLLSIARGATEPLPGADENVLVENGAFDAWTLRSLSENLALARKSNLLVVRNLPQEAWDRSGVANKTPISVRALAYTMLGHERHHLNVLRERYLTAT
jgi:hypothetical protein